MKTRITAPPCARCVWARKEEEGLIYCFRANVCERLREGRENDEQRKKAMAAAGLETGQGDKEITFQMRGVVWTSRRYITIDQWN